MLLALQSTVHTEQGQCIITVEVIIVLMVDRTQVLAEASYLQENYEVRLMAALAHSLWPYHCLSSLSKSSCVPPLRTPLLFYPDLLFLPPLPLPQSVPDPDVDSRRDLR
jgi:hypothetical protein